MLTPEQRALGALTIRAEPGSGALAELLPATDPGALVALAEREGLAGLLYANLRRADLIEALPQRLSQGLNDSYRQTAAANMQRIEDLSRLLGELEAAGKTVFVIKGMALLETLYDDPGVRPTGDVDLWVAEEDLGALLSILRASDYEEQPFYPDIYRRGVTAIDVHTHLLGAERVRAREHIFAAGEDGMFEDNEACGYGRGGRRLAKPQHLLLLALHLLKHNAERLLWLVEINAEVCDCSDEDWGRLLELADRMGQAGSIRQVAFLADLLLPGTVAERFAQRAAGKELGRFRVAALRRRASRGALPMWGPLVFFSSQRGAWKRAVSVVETLFPRPAILRQIFRDTQTSLWRLYFRRFGQLVGWVFR